MITAEELKKDEEIKSFDELIKAIKENRCSDEAFKRDILNFNIMFNDLAKFKEFCAALKENTTITSMFLYIKQLGKEGMRLFADALKQNTGLRELQCGLWSLDFDDVKIIFEGLRQNTELRSLDIRRNALNLASFKEIASALRQNINLETLILRANDGYYRDVFIEIAQALTQNTKLKSLDLSLNNLSSNEIRTIAQALKENNSLQELFLSDCLSFASIDDINVFAEALAQNKSLTTLDISYNKLGQEKRLDTIVKALNKNTTLLNLNLSGNRLDLESMQALGEALKNNSSLESLNVGANTFFESDMIITLFGAFKSNTSITHLDLYNNSFHDPEICELSKVLGQDTRLKSLNLNNCIVQSNCSSEIREASIRSLVQALKQNTRLERLKLYISSNFLTVQHMKIIFEGLKQNDTLLNLELFEVLSGHVLDKGFDEIYKEITQKLYSNKLLFNERFRNEIQSQTEFHALFHVSGPLQLLFCYAGINDKEPAKQDNENAADMHIPKFRV